MKIRIPIWFVKLYGWFKIIFKKDIVSYTTFVCPDCLEILHEHTDIDYIEYYDCPSCGDIKYVGYPDEPKPIGTVVIN